MKIAVVTDDGNRVAQHFGRARYYQVFTVEDGAITGRELRDRTGTLHHGHGDGHHHHDHEHGNGHHHDHQAGGHSHSGDTSADQRGGHSHHDDGGHHHGHGAHSHHGMVAQISDVNILLAGGMGQGARHALAEAGIQVIATAIRETEDAVAAWVAGTIEHSEERLH